MFEIQEHENEEKNSNLDGLSSPELFPDKDIIKENNSGNSPSSKSKSDLLDLRETSFKKKIFDETEIKSIKNKRV
jgi:hypothetical protein